MPPKLVVDIELWACGKSVSSGETRLYFLMETKIWGKTVTYTWPFFKKKSVSKNK